MHDAEFDRHADEYHRLHAQNIRLSGEEPEYFARYKAQDALRISGGKLPTPAVLDFGVGIGNSIPFLHASFPDCRIVGLDVSNRSLEIAKARCGDQAQFHHFDGERIPAGDGEFGLVFAACVFHHIEPHRHIAALAELHRVLTPGGWLILHEHNPRNPLTRRAVRDCPFDERAQLINANTMSDRALAAGFVQTTIRYRVFFPSALNLLRPLERWLTWLPLGAQYCLSSRK